MQYLERDARCITLLPLTTEENEQFYVILYFFKKKKNYTHHEVYTKLHSGDFVKFLNLYNLGMTATVNKTAPLEKRVGELLGLP